MELGVKFMSPSTAWTKAGMHKFSKNLEGPPQNSRCQKGNMSKFHIVDSQILGATIQNLVAQVTWHS
jgi:hypothetical protein